MAWQAAALAFGSGVLQGLQQDSYQKRVRKVGRQNNAELTQLQAENALLGRQNLADIDGARETLAGGFRKARAGTRGAFLRAERGVELGARRANAANEVALLQSGRANTGLLNLARQGVSYSTALQLQEIARSLSGAMSSLDIGEAQADAGLQLGRAGVRSQTFSNKVNLQKAIHANRLGQVPAPIDASAGFGALADLFESLFSSQPAQSQQSTQAAPSDPRFASVDTHRDDGRVGGVA